MVRVDDSITPESLLPDLEHFWTLSGAKIRDIEASWKPEDGSPVFTVEGRYTTQGWTEWTQGFQYGSALLHYDATGDETFLEIGKRKTVEVMATHVSHIGVHDHGFNNVSTYGNLLRLVNEGRIRENTWERNFYELATKISGAVQASRWSCTDDGGGYIYSFNGPQSLFSDTVRSLRVLALAHRLGHVLMSEKDEPVSLLGRLIQHVCATARYNVYYGEGRDIYDVRGRVAHESLFNTNNGNYRCSSTQQGYSPFSTWTRGLAWIILGFPEQLEFLAELDDSELEPFGGRESIEGTMLKAAKASADFYIENTPTDGIPYWDTGAPGLAAMGDYLQRPADPFNEHEPVDSSAASIACQGLIRLGCLLERRGETGAGTRYIRVGLTVLKTLLADPYLSHSKAHQGLIQHAVYHRPNGWDHVPQGHVVPSGEACLWGDYHAREAALYVQRMARGLPDYKFFS